MTTEEKLRTFIKGKFLFEREGALADDDSLLNSGLIDSTGIFELVAFIESEFGIKVLDEEVFPENFQTIGAIAAFIARKRQP